MDLLQPSVRVKKTASWLRPVSLFVVETLTSHANVNRMEIKICGNKIESMQWDFPAWNQTVSRIETNAYESYLHVRWMCNESQLTVDIVFNLTRDRKSVV